MLTHNLDNFFEVSWKISEKCNMNCPYCVVKNKAQFPDAETIRRIAYKINELINIRKCNNSQVYITGGEPYLQDINEIIKLWDSPYLRMVRITSNMSADKEKYLQTRAILKERGVKFLLRASYHNGDFGQFVRKCSECQVDNINIVCNDENYEWYLNELNKFEFDGNKYIVVNNRIMMINWMVERLPGGGIPDTVKNIPKKSRTFSMENGCWCSAGWTTIRIEPFGDIKRCFSTEAEGNILEEIKTFPEKYRCTRKTCSGCQNIFVYDESEIKYFHKD